MGGGAAEGGGAAGRRRAAVGGGGRSVGGGSETRPYGHRTVHPPHGPSTGYPPPRLAPSPTINNQQQTINPKNTHGAVRREPDGPDAVACVREAVLSARGRPGGKQRGVPR